MGESEGTLALAALIGFCTCIADSAESSQTITDGQGVKMYSWAAAKGFVDDILGHVDPNKWDWEEERSEQQ